MSDLLDAAADLEQASRDDALATVRRRVQHGDWHVLSAVDCEICGEPIAPARREAVPGVTTCIECAERAERVGRLDQRTRGW